MKIGIFISSRKCSWTIVGVGIILSIIAFLFLPSAIPMHFSASGIADDYSSKIQIFLFPLLQLIIMWISGKENLRHCLTHWKTLVNDFQYNLIISGTCLLILLVEIRIIYIALT